MFRITDGKGFQITFKNGYTVSVQFGYSNYCENLDKGDWENSWKPAEEGCATAETAVWKGNGAFILYDGSEVQGYNNPEDVLKLLNWAASQP